MKSQSLLWSLTPPEGKPSWLFGTMHIRDDRAYQIAIRLYPLILKTDAYAGEMDLSNSSDAPTQIVYDARKYISEKAFTKLRKQLLKSFRIDIAHVQHLHPLMIMSVISNSVLSAEHMISLDEHLWNFANQNGKEVSGLESYQEQFDILHSIEVGPLYTQIKKLGQRPAGIRKNTGKGLKLYLDGNIHHLYMLSKSSLHELRKLIIYKRNHHMAEVVGNLDGDKSYFIAVGAGHLSGKTGLISALRKKGWKIKSEGHLLKL